MGVVRRNSIWTSIIQYVGVVLGYVNMVILFPRFLDTDEFGLTRILLSVTIVISQFSQFGSPSMIIRFFPKLRQRSLTIGMWVCAIGLTIVLSVLFIFRDLVSEFYAENSSLFVDYIYLLIPFSVAMVYYNLFDAYLKALYKNVLSASMPFIFLRIMWMALILVYAGGNMSFDAFIILYALSYAVITLVTLVYIILKGLMPASLIPGGQDVKHYREIRRFNSFNILSGLSSFMINKVDVLMLGAMIGLTDVGIYSIAAAMAAVIRIPASSIARTAPSLVAEAFHRRDMPAIDNLYKKSAINQFILSAGAFFLIMLNYDLLLYFLPEEYAASLVIFFFLGLAQVIDTGVGINGYIMVNSIYYRVDAFLSIVLLILTVSSNLLLIPVMGVEGAALATVLSIFIYNVIRLSYLKLRLNMQPFTLRNLWAVLLFIIAGLVAWTVPPIGSVWLTAALKSILFLGITLPGIHYMRLSPDLMELFHLGLRMIRK